MVARPTLLFRTGLVRMRPLHGNVRNLCPNDPEMSEAVVGRLFLRGTFAAWLRVPLGMGGSDPTFGIHIPWCSAYAKRRV